MQPQHENTIISMLISLKANGLSENSLEGISDKLMHLDRYTTLDDLELAKQFIASKGNVNYKHELTS